MIERHVTFVVLPDKVKEFEQFFTNEYKPAMSRSAGFNRVDLLVEKAQQSNYQMVIRFETQEDSDAWRNSEDHKILSPKLKKLYRTSLMTAYEVVV